MSSDQATSQPEIESTSSGKVGVDKASKFLSNLSKFTAQGASTVLTRDESRSTSGRQGVKVEPVMRSVLDQADDLAQEAPERNPSAEPTVNGRVGRNRARKKTGENEQFDRTFEVATGKGTRVLTARIPRDLHARVYLVATNNRFAERDAPHTINELVQEALLEWLEKHDAA